MINRIPNSIYKTDIFSIKLPSNWKVVFTDYTYNIYNPLGKGALQISTYLKKDNNDSINLMEEIKKVSKENILKNFKEIKKKNLNYASANFISNDFYTEIRVIYENKENLALLTYNCKNKELDLKEIKVIRKIFNSFYFLDGGKK